MIQCRPFRDEKALFDDAGRIWQTLGEDDWKEAFTHHPKIGDLKSLEEKFKSSGAWAADEQSGVRQGSETVLKALADGNREYEEKFGYLFIVCATGKNEHEMLELLRNRLKNPPTGEIAIAAHEQNKITKLRLEKLLRQ